MRHVSLLTIEPWFFLELLLLEKLNFFFPHQGWHFGKKNGPIMTAGFSYTLITCPRIPFKWSKTVGGVSEPTDRWKCLKYSLASIHLISLGTALTKRKKKGGEN